MEMKEARGVRCRRKEGVKELRCRRKEGVREVKM
jgi:hypothetical protein